MNRIKISLACGLLACSTLASAEFSANIALTSDYVWRGISQTDSDPAIQGGVDFEHDSGFYAGIWASNVDFGSGDDSNVEVDYYLGLNGEVGELLNWTVGAIYYDFPGESGNDAYEVNAGLGASFFGAGAFSSLLSYDPDNENLYYEGALDFEFGDAVGIGFHVGHYDFDEGEDYTEWKVAVSKEVYGIGVELAFTDTDLDDTDDDLVDERLILTISKSISM